jgi:beta-glucanase (GH16 family)
MKVMGWLLLFSLGLTACAAPKNGEVKPTPFNMTTKSGTWELVWSDEFDYTGLPDPAKWGYEIGYIRNNEAQYYTEKRLENARVENGMLIIEARKDGDAVPGATNGYTSASLHTHDTATWTYGRIEVRAKLPHGVGTWPAIWMLGANIDEVGWPTCGEIDIMEHVGFETGKIYATVHTKAYNHTTNSGKGSSVYIPTPHEDFHVYAVEWAADHMDFFVDDRLYFTFKNEGTGNDVWPFDKPYYLILNLAIGGAWGGQYGIDDKIFPQPYYVDYVRVFKASEE